MLMFWQTMLAAIKLEVMTPAADLPDKGCLGLCACFTTSIGFLLFLAMKLLNFVFIIFLLLAVDFYMPPVCTPTVRPGRPAEAAPVISKQLSDVILRYLVDSITVFVVINLLLSCDLRMLN